MLKFTRRTGTFLVKITRPPTRSIEAGEGVREVVRVSTLLTHLAASLKFHNTTFWNDVGLTFTYLTSLYLSIKENSESHKYSKYNNILLSKSTKGNYFSKKCLEQKL